MDPNIQQAEQSAIPQTSEAQVTKIAPPSSLLLNIFIITLGLVIIFGLIGGAYYLAMRKNTNPLAKEKGTIITPTLLQSVTPTSMVSKVPTNTEINLHTYTDPVDHFTFQYPKTMKIVLENTADNVLGLTLSSAPDNSAPVIDIKRLDNQNNLSIQAYNDQYKNNPYNSNPVWDNLSSARLTTVGGKQAYYLQKTASCDPDFCDMYLIEIPNKILELYRINGDPNILGESQSQPIFNTIVSTFKFVQ